jgi:hypothetical protein
MFLAFWLDKNATRYIVTYAASSGEKVDCLRRVMGRGKRVKILATPFTCY